MPTSPGVYVNEVSSGSAPIAGVGTSTAAFIGIALPSWESGKLPDPNVEWPFVRIPPGEAKLCTNFGEFKKYFGDFTRIQWHDHLAHAVYGFFNNGGTRCYVGWIISREGIEDILEVFAAIDEISIIAAPGIKIQSVYDAIIKHCQQDTQDRFAILDSHETAEDDKGYLNLELLKPDTEGSHLPTLSDYAAYYFPWIQVFNPVWNRAIYVPPSGHMAGIYARVDAQRGVHKAPANEVVFGALGLKYTLTRNQQDGLNPQGVNCIRQMNGNIRVWGARTLGGNDNGEFKYIGTRRLFNFLRESIDKGTQWAVFEPNDPALWAKITRNVSAFLKTVWSSGALFGNTPEEAFYVKCDEETNPPEVRNQGQVVAEIGVAITQPAEFVIFNLSQWTGAGQG